MILIDYFDTVNKLIEKMIQESISTKYIDECKKKQSDDSGYWSDETKRQFTNAPYCSIEKRISVLATGGGQKKRFQYCLNPNCPRKFLYFRAIQGHSGSTINPALQDKVLLPEGFTKYIYHVINGKDVRSIVNHGLIPGRVSLKTGRQAVFFTVVNPMDNQDGFGETQCDLSQARIAPYKKYMETLSGYSILVQFEARTTKRTAILSNRIKRSYSLRHTACRVH